MSYLQTFVALVLVTGTCSAVWVACSLRSGSLRRGLLAGAVVLGSVVWTTTELLSLVHGIRPLPVTVVWAVLGGAAAVDGWRHRRVLPRLRRNVAAVWSWPLGVLAAASTGPSVLLAFAAAPNNWDSMTYHLSRVEHWRVHESVSFYATMIDRQLWLSPLSEFGALHLRLLAGDDRLVNLVQLVAFPVAAMAASVVAQRLGLGRRGQLASAVVVLTTPMAAVQSVTTQNDLLCAAFVMIAVAWLLSLTPGTDRAALLHAGGVAVAMGLAMATKPTSLVFLLPFVVAWAWKGRRQVGPLAVQAVLIGVVVLAINAPHLVRTQEVFGTPLGLGQEATGNKRYGVDVTLENLVRNVAMNVATPVSRINTASTDVITKGLEAVGLQADDPANTFPGQPFAVSFDVHEDLTSNLGQLGLIVLAALSLIIFSRDRRRVGVYSLCVLFTLVLFSTLFSWQPWGNRLLLPIFVLAAVPVGALLERLPRRLFTAALVLLVVAVLPWSLSCRLRPVTPFMLGVSTPSVLTVDREHEYFLTRPELEPGYQFATQKVADLGVTDVGLVQGTDSWEYPLWVLLQDKGSPAVLRDLEVTNDSRSLVDDTRPEALICTVECTPPSGWRSKVVGGVTVAWPAGR